MEIAFSEDIKKTYLDSHWEIFRRLQKIRFASWLNSGRGNQEEL
jgi:hypothetical protein